jgi:hypothetical protein
VAHKSPAGVAGTTCRGATRRHHTGSAQAVPRPSALCQTTCASASRRPHPTCVACLAATTVPCRDGAGRQCLRERAARTGRSHSTLRDLYPRWRVTTPGCTKGWELAGGGHRLGQRGQRVRQRICTVRRPSDHVVNQIVLSRRDRRQRRKDSSVKSSTRARQPLRQRSMPSSRPCLESQSKRVTVHVPTPSLGRQG